MKEFDHPNVLSVLGISLNTDHEGGLPFIMLPFMDNGDLKTYLKNKRLNNTGLDDLPEVCVTICAGAIFVYIKATIQKMPIINVCSVKEMVDVLYTIPMQ